MPGHPYEPGSADEPGWLFTEVYDGNARSTYLAVLRADRIADGPVAKVHLDQHVPFSLHGWWEAA